jgi:phosphatidylserine/phosphatidylglycerophosphate/cardiolipin synthase-like enzyme
MQSWQPLAQEVQRLVDALPAEFVAELAQTLREANTQSRQQLQARLLDVIPLPPIRERVRAFLHIWQTYFPETTPEAVSLGLLAAAEVEKCQRRHQRIELVWTGPDSHMIPLRRTDQAILQLIDEAQETLHIVSFAVHKVEAIAQALVRAAQRGVSIAIYLETPDASEGRIAFDTIGALGHEVGQLAQIYVWPVEKRLQAADGRHGSLHAKIALADGQMMLVSSANLTEYALTLNMEMGLLVQGGPLPGQVEAHLERLVEDEIFQQVE